MTDSKRGREDEPLTAAHFVRLRRNLRRRKTPTGPDLLDAALGFWLDSRHHDRFVAVSVASGGRAQLSTPLNAFHIGDYFSVGGDVVSFEGDSVRVETSHNYRQHMVARVRWVDFSVERVDAALDVCLTTAAKTVDLKQAVVDRRQQNYEDIRNAGHNVISLTPIYQHSTRCTKCQRSFLLLEYDFEQSLGGTIVYPPCSGKRADAPSAVSLSTMNSGRAKGA